MGPAIALQSGGKIIAAGASGSLASPPMDAVLVRYNTNGTLDTSFGRAGTGMVFTDIGSSNNFANAVAVQTPGDKIVLAGHALVDFAADTSDIARLRANAGGPPDQRVVVAGDDGSRPQNSGALILNSRASLSSPARKGSGIGMPSFERSSNFARLCSPGSQMRATPGIGLDLRISRASLSTRRLNSSTSPKAAIEIATIAWPVLVGVTSSALKSTVSLPIAAPFSVPASTPTTSASPYPL